jgi:lipopolysaccharide export system permease protein
MKKIDRYVGKIVLGAFVAALSFFLLITILVDLLTNLTKYANTAEEKGIGAVGLATQLGLYYIKLVPVLLTTVAPFATVIAGMMSVARLHSANEIVPMLFVGRSIHRVMRPILWCGMLSASMMVASWQWVVPHVGAELATQSTFLKERKEELKGVVHEKHSDASHYFYASRFDPAKQTMSGVSLLVQGDLPADAFMIKAAQGIWEEKYGDWRLVGGRREASTGGEPIEWLGRPDLTPTAIVKSARDSLDPAMMSYTELLELMEERPNRNDLRLAFHRHITYPLSNLLLLLLALPLAIRYERGSRIDRIMASIALCGGYMLLDLTCQKLGQQQGMLHPIVAAWTPAILFGSLGIVMFSSTRS